MRQEMEKVLQVLFACLTSERLDELAKETGFIQRKRKMTATKFIQLLFQMEGNFSTNTLQELATSYTLSSQEQLSRNGMDKQFKPEAILFLQRVIQEIIVCLHGLEYPVPPSFLETPITAFRIIDSTHVQFKNPLSGSSGHWSVKIQFEFDFLTGNVLFFTVNEQPMSDTNAGKERLALLQENELCVQDLGYFDLTTFRAIQEKGAFFLSKTRADSHLARLSCTPRYHPNGEAIQSSLYEQVNLQALCDKLKPGEYLELDDLYIGTTHRFLCRCILVKQTEKGFAQRLKRIDRRTVQSRKQPKRTVRQRANCTVYMTNLPKNVSTETILSFYRLRWQVELTFKYWKSVLHLKETKALKKGRTMCHIYATLLVAILSQRISYQLRNASAHTKQIEISELVAMRTIAQKVLPIFWQLQRTKKALKEFCQLLSRLLATTAKKSHKKSQTNSTTLTIL
ncbi:MAG: IS4 family transposase [Caryophanon sp.]|nr:IS4 family transposase [Caryophanon sp.]